MWQTINCLWKLNLSGLETWEMGWNQPIAALHPHPVRVFFFSSLARIAVVHPLACQKEGCYSPVVCPVISRSDLCLKIPLQTNKLQSWRLWEIWLFFSFRVLIEAAVASDGEQDNFRSWQVFICFLNGVISHSVVPHGRLTAASSESWSRPAASLSGREIISVESTVVGGLLPSLYCH